MASRHAGRKIAIQALYQNSSRNEEIQVFLDTFIEQTDCDAETKKWGKELALNTYKEINKADSLISQYAVGWSIDRISLIDLSILRLSFYELTCTNTDTGIILNEAIELAKEFSGDDAPKFINGILGKYVETNVHRNSN